MQVKHLFAIVCLINISMFQAQEQFSRQELLKGFDKVQAAQELKKQGLDPREFMDLKQREYLMRRANELGFKKQTHLPRGIKPKPNPATRYMDQMSLTSNCSNSDFSLTNFTNWTCYTYLLPSAGTNTWLMTPSWVLGQTGNLNGPLAYGSAGSAYPVMGVSTTNRHCIINTPLTNNDPTVGPVIGYDSLAINPGTTLADIPLIPPGTTGPVLRLGNSNVGYNASAFPAWEAETEQAVYSMNVNSSTAQFTYRYAVVLNDPSSGPHTTNEQPFFQITVKDQNGNQIGGPCGQYYVTTDMAADSTSPFIEQAGSVWNNFLGVFYKNWTTVSIDLTAQMGQNVTIEFRTADCSRSGHFGYAYLTAQCGPLTANATGICGGVGTSVLTGPPGFSTYQWYGPPNGTVLIPGATSSTYTTTSATVGDVYAVQMVSPSGCNSILNVTITGNNITANYSGTPSCRGGSNGSVSAVIPGGGNYSYTWTNAGGSTIGTSPTVNNVPAGSYTIQIVDNTGTCPPKDSVVQVLQTYPVLQNAVDTLCGTYLVLSSPPSAPFTWYDNNNVNTGVTTQNYTITNGAGGQYYTVTYMNTSTGCLDSLRTTLNAINISFNPVSSPPCNGGSNGSITITGSGSNTFPNYDWTMVGSVPTQTAVNVPIPPNIIQVAGLPQGTYTFSINPTGNPTCTFTTAVTLVQGVIPAPVLDTLKGCGLDNLSIPTTTVSGNTHSWWQGTTSLGSSYPYLTSGVTNGAVYTDTIRNSFGCISVYKAYLKKKDFNLTLTAPIKILCYNDSNGSIKATVTNVINGPLGTPFNFAWNFPAPYIDPPLINGSAAVPQSVQVGNLHPGTYTIVVTSGGCVQTKTITLINPPLLPPDSLYAYYCPKDSIVWLYAQPGLPYYNWLNNGVPIPNYNNDSILVTPATIYNYSVWYLMGNCRDTASILFTFPAYHAFRPDKTANIFTPNGDNRNDNFYPFYDANVSQYEIAKQVEEYEIVIYNRWGKKVFEGTSYTTPWNGEADDKPQDDGTYYYILRFKPNCGTKADIIEKHGFVQLLR